MKVRSLLLSDDAKLSKILTLLLSDFSIETEACTSLQEAREKLFDRKFDGIFADCDHPGAFELIESVRKSKHNKRSIAFAIADSDAGLTPAFQSGAQFVIHKPLSIERSKRTIRAAHGMLMREKRSRYRKNVSVRGRLSVNGRVEYRALLLDLSRTGALIDYEVPLLPGQIISLKFCLPETTDELKVTAVVRWSDVTGRAGVYFKEMSSENERAMMEWAKRFSVELDELPEPSSANAVAISEFEAICYVDLR